MTPSKTWHVTPEEAAEEAAKRIGGGVDAGGLLTGRGLFQLLLAGRRAGWHRFEFEFFAEDRVNFAMYRRTSPYSSRAIAERPEDILLAVIEGFLNATDPEGIEWSVREQI